MSVDDGTGITQILSRAGGTLPQTGNRWLTATADMSAFGGKEVRLRFSFDTGETPLIEPEGWYVDDIWITNACTPVETDLAIDKRDDGSEAAAGTDYTYTLEVRNDGPSDSGGDGHGYVAGPLAVRLVVQRQLQRQWGGSGNGDLLGQPARVGHRDHFTITVAVPSSAVPGTVTNTAHVQANETDPNDGNNTDSEATNVIRHTDLAMDKRDDGSTPWRGRTTRTRWR